MSGYREDGFSLIEILVVVAILGILAAVAIPQYSIYKAGGIDASMESSLRSGLGAMEGYFVENSTYELATVADLEANGYRATPSVELVVESAVADAFVLRACAVGGTVASFVYDSDVGSMTGDPGSC